MHTPIIPIRGWLQQIRKSKRSDEYVGRSSTQRGLGRSPLCAKFKVSAYGRTVAIRRFFESLQTDESLRKHHPGLSGNAWSVTACRRMSVTKTGSLRTSPDEGAPQRGAGWIGSGSPPQVGSSHVVGEICDGKSLASPGRWAVEDRRYPEDEMWRKVSSLQLTLSQRVGTPELLASLALGKVSACPFATEEIEILNKLTSTPFPSSAVIEELACYLKRMSTEAVVEWAPRSTNHEADALASGVTKAFDLARRIPVDLGSHHLGHSRRLWTLSGRWRLTRNSPGLRESFPAGHTNLDGASRKKDCVSGIRGEMELSS